MNPRRARNNTRERASQPARGATPLNLRHARDNIPERGNEKGGPDVAHPLELSYNWRTPAVFATIGAFICVAAVVRGRMAGWEAAAALVVVLWAVFVGVLYLRTRAYLLVEGDRLTVRRYRTFTTVRGEDVLAVSEYLTPHGPSYRLTVRAADGRTERFVAPVALLRDGRATLFAWILAKAPQAELDASSRRTVEALQSKGLLS